ncbi:MAG: DHHA1 domain-containing protein [Candidatus Micrarchaeota archaeon]
MDLEETRKKFAEFAKKNKKKKFVISTHAKADVDAISSAFAVSSVFPNSIVVVPDEMNNQAKALAAKLEIKYQILTNLDKSKFDGLIVTDTSSYALIKPAKEWDVICIIDHHRADGRDMKAENEFFDETAPSCAEFIASFLPKIKNENVAKALCCGIIADTARFKNGKISTFEMLTKLMKIAKMDYKEILALGEYEYTTDSKIAILKAIQRSTYYIIQDYVVVISEVGSNESDASGILSDFVDVAFISSYKEKENECRVSSRGRRRVHVNLNEVMKEVAVSFGGNGGGHAKAAGCSIPGANPQNVLMKCIEVFSRKAGN